MTTYSMIGIIIQDFLWGGDGGKEGINVPSPPPPTACMKQHISQTIHTAMQRPTLPFNSPTRTPSSPIQLPHEGSCSPIQLPHEGSQLFRSTPPRGLSIIPFNSSTRTPSPPIQLPPRGLSTLPFNSPIRSLNSPAQLPHEGSLWLTNKCF